MERRYIHNFAFTSEGHGVPVDTLVLEAIEYLSQCKGIDIAVTGNYTPCSTSRIGHLPKAMPPVLEQGAVNQEEFQALIKLMAGELAALKSEIKSLKEKN